MPEQAVEKIQAEINANRANPYVQVIGQFLIDYVQEHPEIAEKVLSEEKTVAKSLNEMQKAAEKKRVGNMAVLTDSEGFAIVLKYFGIEETRTAVSVKHPLAPSVSHNSDFDVKLDDLLGE